MSWSMFTEKTTGPGVSMSRVIAFLFALTYCPALLLMSWGGHDIGWPLCALGVVIVLAVPLQALFRTFQSWFATPPGKALLKVALDRVMSTAGAAVSGVTSSTTTTVTAAAPAAEGGTAPPAPAQPDKSDPENTG